MITTSVNVHFHSHKDSNFKTRFESYNLNEPLEFHTMAIKSDSAEATFFFKDYDQAVKFMESLVQSFNDWRNHVLPSKNDEILV